MQSTPKPKPVDRWGWSDRILPVPTTEQLAVKMSPAMVERLKNAAYWSPRTMGSIVEAALEAYLPALEDEHGPFPRRKGNLRQKPVRKPKKNA